MICTLNQAKINIFYIKIFELLSYAIGDNSTEKIDLIINDHINNLYYLYGYYIEDDLVGINSYHVDDDILIKYISVEPNFRFQKIGSKLINYLSSSYQTKRIIAETDEAAVKFYKKLGLICAEFEGLYNIRYKCTLNPNS